MLPDTARAWEYLVRTAQDLFARYGYEPIYTPLFEHTDVFARGIGEATDIVGKEMYTFHDRGNPPRRSRCGPRAPRASCARRSSTASPRTARAPSSTTPDPMFRYERPQKGRMRQFWQIGVEALNMPEPSVDAEVIALLMAFFEALGIPRTTMRLLVNSMGDERCRPAYRDKVAELHPRCTLTSCARSATAARTPTRCAPSTARTRRAASSMSEAPLLRDELCDECAAHYAAVKAHLDGLGIGYVEDPKLVRGLDYYTRTVFEVQVEAGLGRPERHRRRRPLRPSDGDLRRSAHAGPRLRARLRAHPARDAGRRSRGPRARHRRGLRRARRRVRRGARRSGSPQRCARRVSRPRWTIRRARSSPSSSRRTGSARASWSSSVPTRSRRGRSPLRDMGTSEEERLPITGLAEALLDRLS